MVPIATGHVLPARSDGRPVRWAATGRSGGVSLPPFDSLNLAGYVGDDPRAVAENRARRRARRGRRPRSAGGDGRRARRRRRRVHRARGRSRGSMRWSPVSPAWPCWRWARTASRSSWSATTARRSRSSTAGGAASWPTSSERRSAVMRDAGRRCRPGRPRAGGLRDVLPRSARSCRRGGAARARPPVAAVALVRRSDGQPGIDVRLGRGAPGWPNWASGRGSITLAGGCTVEDPALFSYRRDGRTGRHGMAVCLVDPARMDSI